MSKALSLDLRVRVLAAVADGTSHRAGALQFLGERGQRQPMAPTCCRASYNPGPGALGGDRHSGRMEQDHKQILGVLADQPDLTVEELRRALAERELRFGVGTLHRFLVRHRMTRKKKTGHASKQDCSDVRQCRQAWAGAKAHLGPGRLVFLDETGAKTNMARTHGRAPRGQQATDERAPWWLAYLDRHRRADCARRCRPLRPRRAHGPRRLRDVRRASAGPGAATR